MSKFCDAPEINGVWWGWGGGITLKLVSWKPYYCENPVLISVKRLSHFLFSFHLILQDDKILYKRFSSNLSRFTPSLTPASHSYMSLSSPLQSYIPWFYVTSLSVLAQFPTPWPTRPLPQPPPILPTMLPSTSLLNSFLSFSSFPHSLPSSQGVFYPFCESHLMNDLLTHLSGGLCCVSWPFQ